MLCFGVIQHTPGPAPRVPDRELVTASGSPPTSTATQPYVDRWSAKTLWRPLTTRLPRDRLRRIVEWYVPRWLPVDTRLARVPKLGRFLTAVVPCWNYTGLYPLDADELVAWAVLDTFDALSPRYDEPQTLETVQAWVREAELVERRRALRRERDRRHRTPAVSSRQLNVGASVSASST